MIQCYLYHGALLYYVIKQSQKEVLQECVIVHIKEQNFTKVQVVNVPIKKSIGATGKALGNRGSNVELKHHGRPPSFAYHFAWLEVLIVLITDC